MGKTSAYRKTIVEGVGSPGDGLLILRKEGVEVCLIFRPASGTLVPNKLFTTKKSQRHTAEIGRESWYSVYGKSVRADNDTFNSVIAEQCEQLSQIRRYVHTTFSSVARLRQAAHVADGKATTAGCAHLHCCGAIALQRFYPYELIPSVPKSCVDFECFTFLHYTWRKKARQTQTTCHRENINL